MGVIFSKSESSQFISNCQANLTGGLEVINDLKSGSDKLMQAIDGKTLSGAAYNAGKGLFGELIIPTITRCGQAIEEMQQDLQRYISANQAIQAASTDTLDEAKLEQKIRESETYRNTIKETADALNSQAFGILGMTNPVTAMLSLANQLFDIQGKLNSYVASLDQDIEKLKQDLRLLQNFVSETQGLFSGSLTNFKIAMQGVTVLGKLIVNNNGTYRFPKGMDKSWFTEKKKTDHNKKELEDTAKHLGIPVEVLMEMYRSFQKEHGKNSYYTKNFVAILKLMKPGALTQGKFSTYGKYGDKTFNYLMQDWRAIKKYLKGLDTPAAQKLLSQMDGSFNQFLKNVEKLKDFKGVAKYTKPLGEAAGWVTDVTKKGVGKLGTKLTKLKPLGKFASKAGWVAMAVDVGYDGFKAYKDKNSAAYHNIGKSAVHAGVSQLKSAGPLEGALAGAAWGGPVGAGVGFVAGGINALGGVFFPKQKDALYGALEKGGDWVVDKIDDGLKSAGKAVQGAWKNVTSFFGGKKHAYT